MRRGDVFWVDFDPARGGEITKTRPAIIVSNQAAINVQNRVQVVPLTSNTGKVHSWEALVRVGDRQAKAMADQIRTVAKERLTNQQGVVSGQDLIAVERAMRVQLGLR